MSSIHNVLDGKIYNSSPPQPRWWFVAVSSIFFIFSPPHLKRSSIFSCLFRPIFIPTLFHSGFWPLSSQPQSFFQCTFFVYFIFCSFELNFDSLGDSTECEASFHSISISFSRTMVKTIPRENFRSLPSVFLPVVITG